MPNGTGVATYGAALTQALASTGHQITGVFGLDPGRRRGLRETLFFEQFGHGTHRRRVALRVAHSIIAHHAARALIEVPLTERVDKRGFGPRWPDFSALWTSPYLFEAAWVRFLLLGRFTTVTMPDPPGIMHWTYPVPVRMAGTRNVYTMHDLVPLKLPHTTRDNKRHYYRLIRQLLDEADHIATVSESSRNDILAMFGADPDKVTNCYQASPLPAAIAAASEADDQALIQSIFDLPPRGFYLFFGASDPKKNIGRIVDGYLASESRRPLVVVSSRDWGMSEANGGLGAGGTVYGRAVDRPIVQLQYLPRETLFRLIRSARAVLFPSLYEGFGLPALEAIQLGTPVISSNTSSLPEVIGGGGLLVDPYDTGAIAAAVRQIDQDDSLFARLSAAGRYQARQFTQDTFARRVDAMYARLSAAKT